jgi:hypothetical protein
VTNSRSQAVTRASRWLLSALCAGRLAELKLANYGAKTTLIDLHLEMLRGFIMSTCIEGDSLRTSPNLARARARGLDPFQNLTGNFHSLHIVRDRLLCTYRPINSAAIILEPVPVAGKQDLRVIFDSFSSPDLLAE